MPKKIEISHRTIIFITLFFIGLYLMYLLSDVIIGLFVTILITSALNPLVSRLERFKIPRSLSILFIYAIFISTIIIAVGTILPSLIEQIDNLVKTLPLASISEKLKLLEVNLENIQIITNQLGSVFPLVRVVTNTFSSIITLFTFMVITYYLLMERKNLHKYLVFLYGDHGAEQKAEQFVNQVEKQIGGWVRGEISLMIIVGLITYIGLVLLNIPYALSLSIFAGFLEIIPNIGPTVAAIPAIIVALTLSHNPLMSIFVIALYILVQQLENNLIVPRIMKSAVGVHPLATILLIIVGLKLAGIAGAVLAVPVFLITRVSYTLLIKPKLNSTK